MTLPLKTGILKYAIERKSGYSVEDIMEALDKDYHGERTFKKSKVENYIFAFCSVHMLEADEVGFNENGELKVTYRITDFGLSNEKYVRGY
jgi:hypothetical protein